MKPHEAYGEISDELIGDVPRHALSQGLSPETVNALCEGLAIALPDGRKALVVAVNEDTVRLDLNHPLAGMELEYNLVIDDLTTKPFLDIELEQLKRMGEGV